MQDLIERLRKAEGNRPDNLGVCTMWHRNPDGPEAADYIVTLEAKLAVAREALEDAQSALRGSGEFDVIAKIAQALQEIEQ